MREKKNEKQRAKERERKKESEREGHISWIYTTKETYFAKCFVIALQKTERVLTSRNIGERMISIHEGGGGDTIGRLSTVIQRRM